MESENLSRLIGRPVEVVPVPVSPAYPQGGLLREGLKGLAGAVVAFVMIVFIRPTPYLGWPISIVGILFFLYLMQQVSRHYLQLHVDDTGVIHKLPWLRKAIRWKELSDLRLNFYPRGKGAVMGMLVLILRDASSRIKVDSSLDHFPTFLAKAAAAAKENGLELHPTTTENLEKLGL